MFNELRVNEYNDLVKLGYLEAGTAPGTFKLSAKGLAAYDRLVESVPAKDQVLMAFKASGNTEQLPAAIQAYMN